ncbi:MAG: FCD domain-containing protein [Pseudolabrys sp.]
MWDSIETRILIDGEGLHLSVKNGDDDWEASVIAAFHSLSRCAARLRSLERDRTDSESEELEARHRAFHFALINASSRRWLLEFSSLLYDQTERYRRPFLAGSELSYERDVHAEHEEIMDSTIARQAEKAAKLLAAHYRRTGDLIEEKLRQSDAEDLSLADPE